MTRCCLIHRVAARLSAAAIIAAFAAGAAFATLGPPVKVKLLGAPAAAEAGKVWSGRIEITVAAPVELTNFRLEGNDWSRARLDAPASAPMQKSGALIVSLSAQPVDPDQPLTFAFDVDGRTITKTLDLSAANAARALGAGRSREATAEETSPVRERSARDPSSPGPVLSDEMEQPASADKVTPRDIRVRGRIIYFGETGETLGADAATIKICDSNPPFDATLAVTTTDPDGYYDVTFTWSGCWNCGDNPDIYVRYEANNDRVRIEDATWEIAYGWQSGIVYGYSGTDLIFRDYWPENSDDHAALHILTNVTRVWRWLLSNRAYDTAGLDVQWPDGSGAYYNAFFGEMHIGNNRQWYEDTLAHEYGHHWMSKYSWSTNPGYCNGVCDGDLLDCGHCMWCPEDQGIAWTEGWPNWLANLVVGTFEADYGDKPRHERTCETLDLCKDVPAAYYMGDPLTTEGLVGAVLQDISDGGTADEHGQFPGYPDALAVGNGPVFVCVDLDTPTSVMDFLNKFKNRYAGWAEQIWQTAKNSGYEIDVTAPSMVTGLTSTSHVTTGNSPDPTIDFTWSHPADDASGVAGYAILVTTTGPALPPSSMSIGDVTTYTTATLAPGTYWFNLRPVDRAGRWCIAPTTFGPVTIRTAEPSNLAFKTLAGWGSVLVPRNAADATAANVPLPTTLTGEAASTWWNTSFQNTGDVATSTFFQVNALVDGKLASGWGVGGPLGGLTSMTALNLGSMTVPGGRHVFEARLDASDVIPELNENDNRWARQWSWTPPVMAAMTPVGRAAPPLRNGGWSSITEGSYTNNCDGVRFSSTGWWNAVAINPANNTDDYDVSLHTPGAGATDGFTSNSAGSARTAGWLDAVIVNRNVMGVSNWDVGVVNYSGGTGTYAVTHHTNYTITFGGAPQTVTLAAGEMMRLWEFYVAPASVGPVTLAVTSTTPSQPVTAVWLNQSFTVGGIDNAAAMLKTDAAGTARLDVTAATAGYHALVVYRDPRDGTAAVTVTVDVGRTKPDLLPVTLSGWAAPLVPRPAADGTVSTVAAPDTLIGGSAATWLNLVVENQSVVDAASQTLAVDLDGAGAWSYLFGVTPAGGRDMLNDGTAVNVRGGRHTLALRADAGSLVAEASETNNAWGVQYAWSPFTVPYGEVRERAAPPAPTGGWTLVASGAPLYYNSDGLRLPARSARWRGLAVMSGEGSDVDLRLHAPMTDPTTGFATPLAVSSWGQEALDFVLVNDTRVGNGVFDVGATLYEEARYYLPETASAISLSANETGLYGPYVLDRGQLWQLRAIGLDAGLWTVRLISLEGEIDWGLSMYSSEASYAGKSGVIPGGMAFLNGNGRDETFTLNVPVSGWHCIAVWKVGLIDVDKGGAYRLQFTRGVSPVPDTAALPLANALVDVRPNPFNPRTQVTFDLADPARTRLTIYDLRGALVRRLVDTSLLAGRHVAVWDGCDQVGQAVASGVYVARFEAGATRQTKRMVLVR